MLPVFNPVIQNFELFYCAATLSKLKRIGLDDFPKWQNGADKYFHGFIALEAVWQRRLSTKLDMRRG